MTDPDGWSEMILRQELTRLEQDYLNINSESAGGGAQVAERKAASDEVKKRMLNVERTLEVISKLNNNLNDKK